MDPIWIALNSTGLRDGAANLPRQLRIAPKEPAMQMKMAYGRSSGRMRKVNETCWLSGPISGRFMETMADAAAPMMTMVARMRACSETVLEARSSASFFCPSFSLPAIIGTNAALNAPSPNSMRSMFGMAKAVLKAACGPSVAPQYEEHAISRANPKTRLANMLTMLTSTLDDNDFDLDMIRLLLLFLTFSFGFQGINWKILPALSYNIL